MSFVEKAEQRAKVLETQSPEITRTQYGALSWSGKDPMKVIALGLVMGRTMSQYRQAIHMTSTYYSQVKHLLKKGRIISALECLQWAILSSKAAMRALPYARTERKLLDMEIAGAPYFLLQKLPFIGHRWRKKAITFLEEDAKLIEKELKQPGAKRPDPLAAGLVWSKLYVLTGHEHYKNWVACAELTRNHDHNQMLRIANHLGFKTLKEFDSFLVI